MSTVSQVFSDLIRYETELWSVIDARLRAECQLPLNWFEPMQVIAQRTECRVDDIAHTLSITVGGTSKLVDRIEAQGYCRRRANPHDRRSSLIELTEAGQQILAQATVLFEGMLHDWLGSSLEPAALAQFHTTLIQLRHALAHKEKR
jgi:DNA-binding MarR family transcriptional regulator